MQRKEIIIDACVEKKPQQVISAIISLTWQYSTNVASDWM